MRINKLIDSPQDPFGELYYLNLETMKTKGILYQINCSFDLFKGLSYKSKKSSKEVALKNLRSFLNNFYFDLEGNYRLSYLFPLLPNEKIKVELDLNGRKIICEGLVKSIKLDSKQRSLLSGYVLKNNSVTLRVFLTKENRELRKKYEIAFFLDNPDKYKSLLISRVSEVEKKQIRNYDNILELESYILNSNKPLSPEVLTSVIRNFDIIKSCLNKDHCIVFGE